MRKLIFAAIAALTVTSCSMNQGANPLLTESDAPFGAPRFDLIETKHYKPAFEQAIAEARAEIDAIIDNPEEPTFENTIEAMEHAGSTLTHVAEIFFNLNEANTNDQMQKVAEEISPMMTEYSMYVSLSQPLFERVKKVYEQRESLGLEPDQMRLLEENYKSFARGGANLPDDKKAEFAKIAEELSLTNLKFSQNVLAATNAFTMHLTDSADLAGLPDFVKEGARAEAQSRGLEGWVFTLNYPSYSPFMQYSERRELREKLSRAYGSRCVSGEFENISNIKKIIDLRTREAQMLGYDTYADFALEERMAKNADNVNSFLENLRAKSLPYAQRDLNAVIEFAKKNGFTDQFMNWDFYYWSDKYNIAEYDLDDSKLKPYFELNATREAVFNLAGRLYGLTFTERNDIPKYHPDVTVYEVKDGDRHMGLLYMDFFPRESKSGGAWMTSFREQYKRNGEEVRPLVSVVTNFTKPAGDMPSLLTFYEVTTLLHEFGHALHGLLSEGRYSSLTGTNVARDFVELPSQIMENWAYEPEFLTSFAKHYQTGEVIPQDLIDKIIKAKNFLAGYYSIGQLRYGISDMAWHSAKVDTTMNIEQIEEAILTGTQLLPRVEGNAFSPSFSHIFAGGYAAGYYSYKWAEVLEADAFSLFKEKGIFNKEVANSFRKNILSRGDHEDADVLFRNFRGRDPRPEALLEKSGMSGKL